MNRLAVALTSISRELEELGARWALVGGLAVSIWAEPRLTRDVDVAVAVSATTKPNDSSASDLSSADGN